MKVAIIGAGLIGAKRAKAITENGDYVVAISDIDQTKARSLVDQIPGATQTTTEEIINNDKIDAVVVATTHNYLTSITYKALSSGKHVLAEKPLGIKSDEIEKCIKIAKENKLIYCAGYNHRFHPAIIKAKEMLGKGSIGKPIFIRGVYGHGGRPGYEKEWRMNKKISGGGQLIDQATHLIDLSLWYTGSTVKDYNSLLTTSFWDIKVEDNVFLTFKTKNKVVTQLHAGWTQWKNKFLFEIFGTSGYLIISGLGGSYGEESLTHGKRIPGKAPKEKVWHFPSDDLSWNKEWNGFKNLIMGKPGYNCTAKNGIYIIKLIEEIYNQTK